MSRRATSSLHWCGAQFEARAEAASMAQPALAPCAWDHSLKLPASVLSHRRSTAVRRAAERACAAAGCTGTDSLTLRTRMVLQHTGRAQAASAPSPRAAQPSGAR